MEREVKIGVGKGINRMFWKDEININRREDLYKEIKIMEYLFIFSYWFFVFIFLKNFICFFKEVIINVNYLLWDLFNFKVIFV